jgi:hypothetical protein
MRIEKTQLTDLALKSAERRGYTYCIGTDDLFAEIPPQGLIKLKMRYAASGQKKTAHLGNYLPGMSMQHALNERERLRGMLAEGRDPSAEAALARAEKRERREAVVARERVEREAERKRRADEGDRRRRLLRELQEAPPSYFESHLTRRIKDDLRPLIRNLCVKAYSEIANQMEEGLLKDLSGHLRRQVLRRLEDVLQAQEDRIGWQLAEILEEAAWSLDRQLEKERERGRPVTPPRRAARATR